MNPPLFYRKDCKMDIQVLSQIITSIGFPIVAAGALFWYVNKLTESHREETEAMRKTIESNTNILIELKELIKHMVVRNDS